MCKKECRSLSYGLTRRSLSTVGTLKCVCVCLWFFSPPTSALYNVVKCPILSLSKSLWYMSRRHFLGPLFLREFRTFLLSLCYSILCSFFCSFSSRDTLIYVYPPPFYFCSKLETRESFKTYERHPFVCYFNLHYV